MGYTFLLLSHFFLHVRKAGDSVFSIWVSLPGGAGLLALAALVGPTASLSLSSPRSGVPALASMGGVCIPSVGGPIASAQTVPSVRGVLGKGGRVFLLLLLGAVAVQQRFR